MAKLITVCIDAIVTMDKNNDRPSYNNEGDYYYQSDIGGVWCRIDAHGEELAIIIVNFVLCFIVFIFWKIQTFEFYEMRRNIKLKQSR